MMAESQVTPTQLVMVREDLSTLPPTSIPQGCTLSSYRPGDESAWEHIIDEAFQGKHNFKRIGGQVGGDKVAHQADGAAQLVLR